MQNVVILENLPVKGLCGIYMSEAQHPIPPLHTVYVYTVYLFTQRGESWTREKFRVEVQQFTKLGRKY